MNRIDCVLPNDGVHRLVKNCKISFYTIELLYLNKMNVCFIDANKGTRDFSG
jgi:hypothetical protein